MTVMMNKPTTLIILVLGLWLSGCSYQWREAEAGITDDELMDLISEISKDASATSGTGNMQKFMSLVQDEFSTIYFAEGYVDNSGTMGPPASILSFLDFTFLGRDNLSVWDLDEARAIFVDTIDEAGVRQNALLLDLMVTGESTMTTKVFVGSGDSGVNDGQFSATLNGDSGGPALVVRSNDVELGSDELAGIIQLQVWDFNNEGEDYLGKISTLVGFN